MRLTLCQQFLFIFLVSGIAAGINNLLSPQPLVLPGNWPDPGKKLNVLAGQPNDPVSADIAEVIAVPLSEATLLIDARDYSEYREGHIPGARPLPFLSLENSLQPIIPELTKVKTVITYCSGEDCEFALFLARELQKRGFSVQFKVFWGGISEWKNAGLPIEI